MIKGEDHVDTCFNASVENPQKPCTET